MGMKRIAASKVYILNNTAPNSPLEIVEQYYNHVVEVSEDKTMINHYPLTEELPMTEWLGGTIVIHKNKVTICTNILSPDEITFSKHINIKD